MIKPNSFANSVAEFLRQWNLIVEVKNTDSLFTSLYLPEKKLNIHCVELSTQKLNGLPQNYFATFNDVIEKQHHKNIQLFEDMWTLKNEIVSKRLLAQAGIQNKIHGRLTSVEKLTSKVSKAFLNAHHLQESANARHHLGLLYKGELVAVATFSKSRLMTYEKKHYRSFELIRFANKTGYSVAGGFSKLLSAFIAAHNVQHLMTYADRDWSNGDSYKKLNFTKIENTAPQAFYVHKTTMQRYFEHRLPDEINAAYIKHKHHDLETFLEKNGFLKIYNSGNTKFILDLRTNEKL